MTPEQHFPTGTDEPAAAPPPGCPAHGVGAGGLRRLYGPGAEDLAAVYEELRGVHGPVAPALLHDDVPLWVVLGHAENLRMVSTPAVFTRDSRTWTPLREGMVKPDHPLMPHIAWQPIASHAEGEEHVRLRGAVRSAIGTIDSRGLRRHINRHSQRLVNRFCERGRAELISQFADHLPMAVMCEVLGMPEEYGDRLVHSARDMLKGTDTAIASNEYVMAALTRLTASRRENPGTDFASHLVRHPAGLSDAEISEHLRLVLIAAYEATANLLGNVLLTVLADPRFRAQLNGGQMTVPEAVEQSLWDEPPFSSVFAYFAKQDTELGGQRIREGDGLLFGIAPGNVDPRVRPDPTAHMQGNRSHLAFGGGPHECPGQDIGRAIADIGVDALLLRLPDAELAVSEDELTWTASIASQHLVELPVHFAPRPQQDVRVVPSIMQRQRRPDDWRIGAPEPGPVGSAEPEPAPAERPFAKQSIFDPAFAARSSAAGATSGVPSAPSTPSGSGAPAASAPAPVAAAAPERDRPAGAWQRFLRWWRGY
ncbi:cytochrome P450 [Streptomyces sp. NPDC090306]|uniref:cytochrome P450 n=1 Tax=Streptomyces sp. NPDC090306 TaxID=3365961 RepID=UPI00381B9B82